MRTLRANLPLGRSFAPLRSRHRRSGIFAIQPHDPAPDRAASKGFRSSRNPMFSQLSSHRTISWAAAMSCCSCSIVIFGFMASPDSLSAPTATREHAIRGSSPGQQIGDRISRRLACIAFRRPGREFDQDLPIASKYLRKAASQVEDVADSIRSGDVGRFGPQCSIVSLACNPRHMSPSRPSRDSPQCPS
jgi:hypothetical protein